MIYKGFRSSKVFGIKVLPFYLFTFLLFMFTGCIEEYEADIPSEDTNLLVVEGTICSGKQNKFILSYTKSVNTSEAPPTMVYGAIVSVRGSDGSEYMTTQGNDGSYLCQIDALAPDVEYYLHIEVGGEVYESYPQKPLRTEEIADVRGVQDTPESDIDVLITPDTPFDPDQTHYYSWTYDETWEVHPAYTTFIYYDVENRTSAINPRQFSWRGWMDATSSTIMIGASTNYDGEHIQKLKLYDISRNNKRVFYRYSGLVHQRAISKAEYEYESARRQAGMEMGGLFTPQPSALPTNIHCLTSKKHVIGFVGCSLNTSEYRFFLNAEDFSILYPKANDTRVWLVNPSHEVCLGMVIQGYYLCEWFVSGTDGSLQTAWATIEQLDVRCQGAYIEEPDFWPQEDDESNEDE